VGNGHGERLSRDQEQAIACLLSSPTVVEAAGRCGVHPNTLRAWMRQPAFAAAYAEARQELLRRTVHRMQLAMLAAVNALEKDCGAADFEQRFKAAELLLNTGIRAAEQLSLLERIEGLERLAKGEGDDPVQQS
jgi:transposase-like protein